MTEIDFSKLIIHDSAKPKYRWPAGAVPRDTKVALCVEIRDIEVKEVYLEVLRGVEKTSIRMERTQGSAPTNAEWCVEYGVGHDIGALWYWFAVKLTDNNNIYYGADVGRTCGNGKAYWRMPPAFQLTVYDEGFYTPNWLKNSIMYHIFPDRFASGDREQFMEGVQYHREMGHTVVLHEDWNEKPLFEPSEGMDHYQPCDYFGGDLQGIIDRLDYLRGLGINLIYLTPIFEAASNHRYNASDYKKIDPMLGTGEDFDRLVKEAGHRGIQIVLDGVFSHTGDDSVYFNKYGRYDSVGAYQSKDSPYYRWYKFAEFPDKYASWWGFDSLPEVNEKEPDWVEFVIEGEDSVIAHWLKKGVAGFRLDVVDELPDETIEKMRNAIKYASQDKVLLGEAWDDATAKESNGEYRKYALGAGLDSVMNYPLKDAIIRFILGNTTAEEFKNFLVAQSQNYPKEMYYSLMNLLSSHDVVRVRTVFSTDIVPSELSREEQAHFIYTPAQEKHGAQLQRLAAAIQFVLPGVPCVYYGDEVGMLGMLDPFNRRSYYVKDAHMREFYSKLAALRNDNTALRTGYCIFAAHSGDIISVLRFCYHGKDAFGNVAEDSMFLTLVNRAPKAGKMVVDLLSEEQLQTREVLEFLRDVDFDSAVCALTGDTFPIRGGLVEVDMPPESVRILELIWL